MILFQQMLLCALERREGIYRRKKRLMNFDPFTPSMKRVLNDEQDRIYNVIKKYQRSITSKSTESLTTR